MKKLILSFTLALLALLTLNSQLTTAHAQGTAFTYNGLLQKGSAPQSGTFNFTFTLYNVATGGTPIAGPVTLTGVAVKTGAFTVTLDFGAAVWNGQDNWLEIEVEANGDSGFTTLAPRQEMLPTPYAIYAETANNFSGTLSFSQLTGTIDNSQLANSSLTVAAGSGLTGGGLVSLGGETTLSVAPGSVNNSMLANNSITITPGPGLGGGGTVALGGSTILNNTGVTSLTGGDGVTVSAATGDLTLGLGSTLTLPNLPVAINTGNSSLLYANNNGNYFTGPGAGNPAVTGYGNTAGGSGALANDTTGYGNTAYGAGALNSNSGGYENTAEGLNALQYTTGSQNTANGASALQFNQTGSGNTANGASALLENNTGSFNVASGWDVLLNNSSGSFNTANGSGALEQNEGGSYNVGDGANTLTANDRGTYNTAVGYFALNQLGTRTPAQGGTNNIAIGNGAGSAFTGNESSNIDIGNLGVAGENNITRIGTTQTAAYIAGIIIGDGSGLVNLNGSQITGGTINNSQLANSSITVTAGAGLTGGGTFQLGGSTILSVKPGSVDNSMLVNSTITVNTGPGLSSSGSPVALGGTITLNNSGVTSLTGGDGVTVSAATGDLTLGLGSTITLGDFPVSIISASPGGPSSSLFYADSSQNIFTGYMAGSPGLSGQHNTGNGAGALGSNQIGSNNTGVGAQALSRNDSGNNNTADGFNALFWNWTGSYNTAVGGSALQQNETGNYNTAVGGNALSVLMGGTNNIAIGNGAGSAFTANESSNIDIGNVGVQGENNITRIGTTQTAAYIAGIIIGNGSGLTSINGSQITGGTINNSQLANNSITVSTGAGLSSSGSPVALGGTITLNNTGVTSLTGGGGVTVSAPSGAVTLGSTATSANTPNTIVSRDGTGSFSAQSLTLAGILNLPAPSVTINSGANSLLLGDVHDNLFLGLAAGNSTTTGAQNTGVGAAALGADTTGYGNVANGYQALYNNADGFNNTANGYQALFSNTSGFDNVASGWQSLLDNTTGWYNTADGIWALQANTAGNNNTAVGYDALGGNTTGTQNTAYGVHANLYNTTGSNNVAVGFWSLNYCTGGSGNIALGYQAGINFSGSESGNIDIGNAGKPGDNDVIRIGTPGIQTTTSLAGICNSHVGYGCLQGTAGTLFGNTFNFWWTTNNQLQAWVDNIAVGVVMFTSDRRLKENIQPMADDALTRVMALKPSTFKYKNIPGTVFQGDGTKEEGFIADELQQVIPSAVNGQTNAVTSNGTIQPQTVNLMPLVAVLTKAVQEQQQEINDLKAQIKTLSEHN